MDVYYHEIPNSSLNKQYRKCFETPDDAYSVRAKTLGELLLQFGDKTVLAVQKRTDHFWHDSKNPEGVWVSSRRWVSVPGYLGKRAWVNTNIGTFSEVERVRNPEQKEAIRQRIAHTELEGEVRFGEWRC